MKIFTNYNWLHFYYASQFEYYNNEEYGECLCKSYKLHPFEDQIASTNSLVFDPKKAAALYFWYKSADRSNDCIIEFFEEYKKCIDETHKQFNSNYGYYAYKCYGLQRCIDTLIKNKNSRQACFCINNNSAMSPRSIDKLCTNTIQFFIRNDELIMLVQMRSSNLLTMLPYDFFTFCIWYAQVYNKLIQTYPELKVNYINVQVASLHYYRSDYVKKDVITAPSNNLTHLFGYKEVCDKNFEKILEEKLAKFLNN